VRVVAGTRFDYPLQAGFDYITDLRSWPEYWPNLISLRPESRWSEPGDTAWLTLKLAGRATELEMTLTRLVPCRLVEYTSVQRGLPVARHERHFDEDGDGFGYRIVVDLEPRGGLRGVFDRLVVRRAVERTAQQTLRNLERRFMTR
jgi:polyketide cyclase/dehydrase/lipid transport protein